jgi:N-acetylglucosamine-6-phosphate deacetylase
MMIAGDLARGGVQTPGWVEIDGERIAAAGAGVPPRGPDLVHEGVIAPGFVDLQLNGAVGVEVTGGPDALDRIERALLASGVTRCLATVVTCEEERAVAAVRGIETRTDDPRSPIAGLHLEGPFLAPAHAGVHRTELLRAPADGLPSYYRSPALRLVTLAPELPGAMPLIDGLRRRGVAVALGHSGATAAQAIKAFDAGARLVTHIFNAMAPLHHREPGLAGAALQDDRVTVGVIADGQHVNPLVLGLVRRLAGPRVALVSDASPLAAPASARDVAGSGPQQGEVVLAGVSARARAGGAPITAEGRLAGTAILLDEAVRRWHRLTGATLAQAVAAASEQPAAAVGLPAGIDPGARADLVLLDDQGAVGRTLHGGRWFT